jgi:gamma-glutamyl:cysteine ligase YbdK (ATP-grasp superfamily)
VRRPALRLFEGYGVELEYMIVDRTTLDILPIADEILRDAAGRYTTQVSRGHIGWSNELVLHVMELKNNEPDPTFRGLDDAFQDSISGLNGLLEPRGGMLMPTGMHPWMNPARETRLWQRRNRRIYETYDRIFGCRRHGWANVQSMHLNLPFQGDDEFGRLHAAIRLLLPLIPALAASSPVVEGRSSGMLDTRLVYYSRNQRKVPSVTGKIIPEPVFARTEYRKKIFGKIYNDIAAYDREGILRHEWLNSRGAIPRFERSAFEIRLIDVQECPAADVAIAALISAVLQTLVSGKWSDYDAQARWKVSRLLPVFKETMWHAEEAVIFDSQYLRLFGIAETHAKAGEVWRHLAGEVLSSRHMIPEKCREALMVTLVHGPLSRRILKALGNNFTPERLRTVYGKLCTSLAKGVMFLG